MPSDIVSISSTSPEDAAADWIGCYVALLRSDSDMPYAVRRKLRTAYMKSKSVLVAILSGTKGSLVTPKGVFCLETDAATRTPYPVWLPKAKPGRKPKQAA